MALSGVIHTSGSDLRTARARADLAGVHGWRAAVTYDLRTGTVLRVDFERTSDDAQPFGLAVLRALSSRDVARLIAAFRHHVEHVPKAAQRKGDRRVMLAAVAKVYVDAVNAGERKPRHVAARRLRKTPEQIRDLVHEARRAELLEGGAHGTATGTRLTTTAIELLGG